MITKKQFTQFKELMTKAFKMTASKEVTERIRGAALMAKAFEVPLRKGVLAGDIVSMIYTAMEFPYGTVIEFPMDPVAPGTEKEYVAYTIPGEGDLPTKQLEGDYVTIPTYEVAFAISWLQRHARDARWDILARYLQVMEAGFVKKRNDDGWRGLIAGAFDRNIIVLDSQAAPGAFTKRLVSNMKLVFARNGGGNTSSIDRRFLTDLWLSPENVEEMRNWGLDQVDEITRREIYVGSEDTLTGDDRGQRLARVFGVNLHPIVELGETQEYQRFFTNDLGASLATGDVELLIGINTDSSNSFIHPYRQLPEIVPDGKLMDFRKAGLLGIADWGFGIFDNRDVLLGSC